MSISIRELQRVVNLSAEYGREETAKKMGVEVDTIRRYEAAARKEGLEVVGEPIKLPKIFVFDLENAPSKAAVWRMWDQDINNDQITEEWYMLSWAGKWLFDTEMFSDVLTPEEAVDGRDGRIMASLWDFIDHADILVGHNINGFDVSKMNTRFVINGIMPPSPYQTIDTLYAARKNFSFSHNKLDYLCEQFGVARKADNGGMKRWIGCCDGNSQDLLDMEAYNRQDITATEELYLAIRPWIKSHPNLALYMDNKSDACYKCGSPDMVWLQDKFYYTGVNKYSVYRCDKCNSVGRSRYTAISKEQKKYITSPVAR